MTNILTEIADNKGARKSRTRIGRGIGSGKGKTGGRGIKGQKARSGVAIKGFEGGQMPIFRRLPKRGFNNPLGRELEITNVGVLQEFVESKKLDDKKPINKEALVKAGIVNGNKDGIKLLGKGEIKAKITVAVDFASKSAIAAVEKAGGKVSITAQAKKEVKEKNPKDKGDSSAKKSEAA